MVFECKMNTMKKDLIKSAIGTKHVLKFPINGIQQSMVYECLYISGIEKHLPMGAVPIVYLKIAGRYGVGAPAYLTLPLQEFIKISEPLEKDDRFYEFDVNPGQPSEAEIKRPNVK